MIEICVGLDEFQSMEEFELYVRMYCAAIFATDLDRRSDV
jgi:hypothetical protein